jgi:SAM-dependent methyltransferase
MALFKNPNDSHVHSLNILNLLPEYDTFLDSLSVIADMGCGAGLDARWWANLETRDDPIEPRNYLVYAVDQNIRQFEYDPKTIKNMVVMEGNFEERVVPRQVDLIWAHDSFQYARNPLKCLASWKNTLNENGMLILSIPQTTYWDSRFNRLVVSNHNHQYYSYNVLNLMYMLAISGFDCRDAFFYREPNSPWLYAAVYASNQSPIGQHATWHDLAENYLVSDSIINSVNTYGYARLEDVVVRWFDKNYYQITN